MSKELNAECLICGAKYHSCMSCREQKEIKPWRNITDTVEHYKIFLIVSDYNSGKITKEDAKSKLENVKYDIKSLKENIQKTISEITSNTTDKKKIVEKEK